VKVANAVYIGVEKQLRESSGATHALLSSSWRLSRSRWESDRQRREAVSSHRSLAVFRSSKPVSESILKPVSVCMCN